MTGDVLQRDGGQAPHILVVDDNEINAILATRLLQKLGCLVTCAENGQIALDLLDAGQFDAVLMDVQMPVMDGIESTRRIRERERARGSRRLPICALTAHIQSASERDCLAAGMDAYQLKPFDMRALRAVLDRLLPVGSESRAAPT